MPDLQVTDLTVEFVKGDYTVRPIDDMTFTVKAGSLALLLGPSGCGKTSLLSCLAAIMRPTSGTVVYNLEHSFRPAYMWPLRIVDDRSQEVLDKVRLATRQITCLEVA